MSKFFRYAAMSLLTVGVSAHAEPCDKIFLKKLKSLTKISQPAKGSADEVLPPRKGRSIDDRIKPVANVHTLGDQCAAVLGPLPKIDCSDATLLPTKINGKTASFEKGEFRVGGELIPKKSWIDTNLECDSPTMIPFMLADPKKKLPFLKYIACEINEGYGHKRIGNVDWVYLCHSVMTPNGPPAGPNGLSVIGSNRTTGETCFFVTRRPPNKKPLPMKKIPLPGNKGNVETVAEAKKIWNVGASAGDCLACHANNKPWLVTPHLNEKRVGGKFSVTPNLRRKIKRRSEWGYRVIGTAHNFKLPDNARVIIPKRDDGKRDQTCTSCHLLSTLNTYVRLARNSVGMPDLPAYTQVSADIPKIKHPWMPGDGDSPENYTKKELEQAIANYERAVKDPTYRALDAPAFSRCPQPKPLPANAAKVVAPGKVAWTYDNDYGGVPLRDDIRFAVKITSSNGNTCTVRDVAPSKLGSNQWRLQHPVPICQNGDPNCDRFNYEIIPYRYCFDKESYRFAKSRVRL